MTPRYECWWSGAAVRLATDAALEMSKEKRAEDRQGGSYNAGAESENDRPVEQGAVGRRAIAHGQNSLDSVTSRTHGPLRRADGRLGERDDSRRPAAASRHPVWGGARSQTGAVSRRPDLGGLPPSRLSHRETLKFPRFLPREGVSEPPAAVNWLANSIYR